MSKYYKAEDVISKIVNTPTRVITGDLTALVDRQHEIIDMLSDLPTIEVSEDCSDYYKGYCARYEDGCFQQCKNAPSVVPTTEQSSVVRCKDCKHYHASKHYAYCTVINVKGKHPQPNDYCSYAEEK